MRLYIGKWFFAASLLCILSSCKDEPLDVQPVGNMRVHFTPVYAGVPLVQGATLTYPDETRFQVEDFGFFVSDMALIANSNMVGEELAELAEIDWIDQNFASQEAAMAGYILTFDGIPSGTYLGIQLGLGVAADYNREQPKDYALSHPLSDEQLYRSAWQSYIFCQIKGRWSADGGTTYGESFQFDLGMDEVFHQFAQIQAIDIVEDQTTEVYLQIELQAFFDSPASLCDGDGDAFLDFDRCGIITEKDDMSIMQALMNNLGDAFTIR